MREFEDWMSRNRFFPRVFSVFYLVIVYQANDIFWAIGEPNNAHSVAYSALSASAAAWFKFYVDGGRDV